LCSVFLKKNVLQSSKVKVRFNLLLAVDINVGVVAYQIYRENTTADVFTAFIRDRVLPVLAPGVERIFLWDNLAAHFTENKAIGLIKNAGHLVVSRPSYSPDMAPIESAFSKMKYLMRRNHDVISSNNFAEAIDLAVREITSEDCAGWFQDCHYFVPGKSYKPYLGCALDKSFQ